MLSTSYIWFLRRYREVSIVLGLNILALGIYVFNITYSIDDYNYLLKPCDLIAIGRWAFHILYNYMGMNNFLPVLSPLAGMTAMTLAGFELTRLWRIRIFTHRILIMSFFALHPYVLEMYNFRINIAAVPLAYYLTLLALNQRKRWMALGLFSISLGIYQAVLGMAACAWLLTLLFQIQSRNYQLDKPILHRHLKGWLWMILGIITYFLIMKITLLGNQANCRIEAGFFGNDPFRNLLKYSFILFLRLSFIPEYVIPLIPKIALFTCIVLGAGILLIQSRLRFWIVLILMVLPYIAICHMLPLANADVPWRISFGLIVLVAGLLTVILRNPKLKKTGLIIGYVMIISFIIIDNARMFERYIQNQRDISMANRIAARIESMEGYRPGMKWIIIGNLGPKSLTWNRQFNLETVQDWIRYYSHNQFGLEGCFASSWGKYTIFNNYLQIPLTSAGPDDVAAAKQWIQQRQSQPWPHSSSIFIAEDSVVLFLSAQNQDAQ